MRMVFFGLALVAVTASAHAQDMQTYTQQHAQLMGQMNRCQAVVERGMMMMRNGAMSGNPVVVPLPPCWNDRAQQIAQLAFIETQIYHLQNPGDHTSHVCDVTAACNTPSPRTAPNANYDRGAIRGTSIYTDSFGEEYELPTNTYVYRDRASGRIFGGDQPPPNNGRDYENLQAQ